MIEADDRAIDAGGGICGQGEGTHVFAVDHGRAICLGDAFAGLLVDQIREGGNIRVGLATPIES